MILCIGELLADITGREKGDALAMEARVGGAPFNVAVNAKQSGAKVAFIGRVGFDAVGRFLIDRAEQAGLDSLEIQVDDKRNTTLAFVTLSGGERDFSFYRGDTADFRISGEAIDSPAFGNADIVHLGSLMLSEKAGREFARTAAKKIRAAGKIFSFDVNYRADLYESVERAKEYYAPFIEQADILKFSEDEIAAFTGENDPEVAARKIYRDGSLLIITLGSRGSAFMLNGKWQTVPCEKVTPLDTTGAGDAFFGAVLAYLDGRKIDEKTVRSALENGNSKGAQTTLFAGAVRF